jgi:hypothetical protein
MSMLRDLLATWENWSARDTLSRSLANVTTEDSRERITGCLAAAPAACALEALRDSTELVELLIGWQWQAVYAARIDGASWAQIGTMTHTTADDARASFAEVLDRQEALLGRDVEPYRGVI